MSSKSKKVLSISFYALMAVSILVLAKTELRKWFVLEGEPSSANTLLFWISLVLAILFGFCGSKLWPKKENNK